MQLDRASVALRAREPWEAMDLGAAMIRDWWRPVYAAWFAVVLPVALIAATLVELRPWTALLLLWWLKPLYDRIVLHVLGSAVFGEVPGVRATLARLPAILRSSALAAALTWRRFDALRSFHLPVRQLEQQRGRAARERERVLGRRAAGHASSLLYVCIMFELVVAISLGAMVDLFTPAAIESEYGVRALLRHLWGAEQAGWAAYVNFAFLFLAISVVEPLYVASGFALYLNRRTTLEAWDLELEFRRAAAARTAGSGAASLLLACMLLFGASDASLAQEPTQRSSREIIREVLAAPEFQHYRTEKTWQRRSAAEASTPEHRPGELLRWFASFSDALAVLLRYAAYALILVALVFALRYLLRELTRRGSGAAPEAQASRPPPEILFGLDVRPEALPQDLARAAASIARTDARAALSLLYRGALVTLIHRDRLAVREGDTEGDCVRQVARTGPQELSRYFACLVESWIRTAYGGRPPDPSALARLCDEWPQHFSPPT